jgi:hypothetical protein
MRNEKALNIPFTKEHYIFTKEHYIKSIEVIFFGKKRAM